MGPDILSSTVDTSLDSIISKLKEDNRQMEEHYDPEFDQRQMDAEEAKRVVGEFLYDQATDPLNYVGGAGGWALKGLRKALAVLAGLSQAGDAHSMVLGGRALAKFSELMRGVKEGTPIAKEMWDKYSLFFNPRGELRQFVPDNIPQTHNIDAVMKALREGDKMPLSAAYPAQAVRQFPNQLGNIGVRRMYNAPPRVAGVFDYGKGRVELNTYPHMLRDPMSILAHETQHGAQYRFLSPEWTKGGKDDLYRKRALTGSAPSMVTTEEEARRLVNLESAIKGIDNDLRGQLPDFQRNMLKRKQDLLKSEYDDLLNEIKVRYRSNPGETEAVFSEVTRGKTKEELSPDKILNWYYNYLGKKGDLDQYLNHEGMLRDFGFSPEY